MTRDEIWRRLHSRASLATKGYDGDPAATAEAIDATAGCIPAISR